jgi:hypothetical protein
MHVWVCNEEICPMDAHVLKDASIQCEFKGDRTKIKQVLSLFIWYKLEAHEKMTLIDGIQTHMWTS